MVEYKRHCVQIVFGWWTAENASMSSTQLFLSLGVISVYAPRILQIKQTLDGFSLGFKLREPNQHA